MLVQLISLVRRAYQFQQLTAFLRAMLISGVWKRKEVAV